MIQDLKTYKEAFFVKGKEVEKKFQDLFSKTSLPTNKENILEHWDVCVGVRVEVKGMKKVFRSDNEPNENIHWLEILNNNGKHGWVYGDADYFAFETKKYFIIVEAETLRNWIKLNVSKDKCTDPEPYKLYTRENHKDIITLIPTLDLAHMSTAIIQK